MVRETPLPRSLSRLLLGLRGVPQQEAEASAGSAAISVRSLSSEELAETGEGSKLDLVAKLCTRGMFGEANAGGSNWVLRNFKTKYGEEAAAGRQSIMLVAETSDGDIVGCVGMELMLLTEDGRAWWANPCAIIKKRPFVSDLVVDATYRQRGLGRSLLLKCHDIVTSQWAEEIRAMTPAERLDLDVDRIFLKVDAENRAAVRLYRVMTCLAVSHALLAQYLACLCQMLSLPPCSTHLLAQPRENAPQFARQCSDIGRGSHRFHYLDASRTHRPLIFLYPDTECPPFLGRGIQRLGYKEVATMPEELMVPKSPNSVQEWPVLNIYMGRDLRPFNPLAPFKGG